MPTSVQLPCWASHTHSQSYSMYHPYLIVHPTCSFLSSMELQTDFLVRGHETDSLTLSFQWHISSLRKGTSLCKITLHHSLLLSTPLSFRSQCVTSFSSVPHFCLVLSLALILHNLLLTTSSKLQWHNFFSLSLPWLPIQITAAAWS